MCQMKKFYFKNSDAELCYDKKYFIDKMKQQGIDKMEVFRAVPGIIGGGIFWCKQHLFCGDDSRTSCGKSNCNDYKPKNGNSGACKHHTHWLYNHGDKIKLYQ